MKRMRILFGQRRFQVLATMAVLLLAVSVIMASGANFTASSANPSNVFTSGALSIGNFRADDSDNEGGVVLTATNIVPGGPSITGTAKIKNTGTVDGLFTLTGTYIANPPAPIAASDLAFAHTLQCVITENGSQIYAGPLDTIDTIDLKEVAGVQQPWSAGETRTFVFTVTWPDGDPADDNLLMGKSATIDLDWSAVGI